MRPETVLSPELVPNVPQLEALAALDLELGGFTLTMLTSWVLQIRLGLDTICILKFTRGS